jgi:hypothetical protein
MFGCALVVNVPEIVEPTKEFAVTCPPTPTPPLTTNAPDVKVVDATVDVILTVPEEVSPVKIPKLVIFGCDEVATVPVNELATTVPALT